MKRSAAPTLHMLVGDRWVDSVSGDRFSIMNPARGTELATAPEAVAEDIDRAVDAATAAFPSWSRMDAAKRGHLLMKLADRLDDQGKRIAGIESADNGRPIRETSAQAGIVAKWFRYLGGMADKIQGATIPVEGPFLNYTRRVPLGVCGALTPWNHPSLIAAKKVAPALACGTRWC